MVEWDHFLHAMMDLGFSARHRGGSTVIFEKDAHTDDKKLGRLVVHKLHPVPKTGAVML